MGPNGDPLGPTYFCVEGMFPICICVPSSDCQKGHTIEGSRKVVEA